MYCNYKFWRFCRHFYSFCRRTLNPNTKRFLNLLELKLSRELKISLQTFWLYYIYSRMDINVFLYMCIVYIVKIQIYIFKKQCMVVSGTVATTYIPPSQVRAVPPPPPLQPMVRSRGVFGSGIYRERRRRSRESEPESPPPILHTLSSLIQ